MIEISSRFSQAKASATLEVAAKARARKEQGLEVVSFATGEPDFDTPAHIKAAAARALEEGMTRYPPVSGLPDLRRAVVDNLSESRGLSYDPSEVLVTVGAKQAIYNLCQVVLEEGAEAIILSPYWVSYPEMVRLAGALPVVIPSDPEDDFNPRVDALADALNESTRMLFINSPCNPSGAVIRRDTLLEIAELLRRYPRVVVMTDDIYARILFGSFEFENLVTVAPDLRDRVVVVDGVSKAYAMTGWRVGWAVGPRALIDPMTVLQGQSTSGVAGFAQAGAIEALSGDQSVVSSMVAEFARRRERMVEGLNAIAPLSCRYPGGAFYAFPDVRGILGRSSGDDRVRTSGDLARLLIERHGVAVVDGAPFGADGFVRLSFATSMEQIERGLGYIEEFVSSLSAD